MTSFGIPDFAFFVMALSATGVMVTLQLRHRSVLLQATSRLVDALPEDVISARAKSSSNIFATCIDRVCERLAQLESRIVQRHPVTGLETREVLLQALAAAPVGQRALGIVTLADFDALTAFDADAANIVLNTVAKRLVRMMPVGRLLVQVDRATFAILFENDDVETVAEELQAVSYALLGRVLAPGVEYLPQIKQGHVCVPSPIVKVEGVLAQALASVYGSYPAVSGPHFAPGTDVFAIEQDLRQAVEKHQLELYYQPVIDARTGSICSAEALIRWQHPDRGMVPPSQFIPVMESIGLSEEIGNWVLDRAARDAAAWARDGCDHVKVAVNLSAHQLVRRNLDVIVERVIARHQLPAAKLELELTETAAAVDSAAARTLFAKLRAQGVTMVIDDFGAGYASLSYLKRLEFDKLKIDREFVTNVNTDKEAQAICLSIIALARGLGLTVLGEGVESREEFDWLHAQGCNLFQGYYFAKPLPYTELLAFAAASAPVREKCAARGEPRKQDLGVLAA